MSEEEEARRNLARLEAEREKLIAPSSPADSADDPIERLGRRIARILGYAVALGLIFYLWTLIDR